MPLLDWSQCPAVESIPGRVSGAWVLDRDQVKAVIEFAARSLDTPVSSR
jgi:hypothetical protein